MTTLVNITNDLIKERNLAYSPKVFSEIYNEVKSTPKYIEEENKRQEILNNVYSTEDYLVSFMSNHLTTDSRLK